MLELSVTKSMATETTKLTDSQAFTKSLISSMCRYTNPCSCFQKKKRFLLNTLTLQPFIGIIFARITHKLQNMFDNKHITYKPLWCFSFHTQPHRFPYCPPASCASSLVLHLFLFKHFPSLRALCQQSFSRSMSHSARHALTTQQSIPTPALAHGECTSGRSTRGGQEPIQACAAWKHLR